MYVADDAVDDACVGEAGIVSRSSSIESSLLFLSEFYLFVGFG